MEYLVAAPCNEGVVWISRYVQDVVHGRIDEGDGMAGRVCPIVGDLLYFYFETW